MKVCFDIFGCRLNRAEALDEEARYLAAGYERVSSHADADVIVVRACSVTSRAQRDCEKLVAHLREKYPDKRIRVTGCSHDAERGVDTTLGAFAEGVAPIPKSTARAYLKVQDGCGERCAFCIVPQFRGPSVSLGFDEIIGRARRFIDAGYHEIVVTGCNLTRYASGGKRLPELVAALASLTEQPTYDMQGCPSTLDRTRIRLGSVEPGACAAELVSAMAENSNVCRTLHLAVQSGSDTILKSMKRPYSATDVAEIAQLARRLMPHVGLGCDMMTGFPGENESDFRATKQLLLTFPFSSVHVFPFSRRPGTPAATMPMQLPVEVKTARAHRLAELAESNRLRYIRSFLRRYVEIVVESSKSGAGWTSEYVKAFPERASSSGDEAAESVAKRRELATMLVTKVEDGILRGICR